ncbi:MULTISPECIES: hypothetical protein [Methylobacterium]|uniref:Uncharacterized protein n=1 Tax=Methylobacterium jeotgali TaxID=381630 RepID=A0ABQ4SWZ5_9HYPH|nr:MULTISPECIES: hypothetical protein [Methylobacterium]PIU05009.1 MAG: hypothetical protein COT56_17225 [Methylobacterium sp. CG09_land_8_20_14_0_10_71_15]PIU11510.1 MAG: hypothetical protein COT28_19720 [Methylobacterium sp. CG08_land_8_20_14_0_20_71_15]GBU16577.1 hypothetical protein AwMethylo_07920 [Methylobacterium sp.]GJE07617.1 hypothetical protein AOPFMNJM_2946 [Methylobacterium jeotgali]
MLNADPLSTRPTLLQPSLLARTLDGLRQQATSEAQVWDLLTRNYVVDLDAVASLLPARQPEPVWLASRD